MIRKIYKIDYRGYEVTPMRKEREELKQLKYSIASDRNEIKKYLMEDFFLKCAYCGWSSKGYGASYFHIEHIKSQYDYEDLKDDYTNYALCCAVCNCSKGKRELSEYIDPIDQEFKKMFYRNKFGEIVVDNKISGNREELAKEYLKKIGLFKEVHKLDYIYDSLNRILEKEIDKDNSDIIFMKELLKIIQYINSFTRVTDYAK